MAQKRMFDKTITNSDDFLEMPDSSQNLYFHLSMNADDDGFVNNWKSIMRMTGHKEDDLKVLIAKQFIIPFDTGVIVIRHWRVNNYLRSDRYTETKFTNEMKLLELDDSLVYQLATNGKPRLDKIRLDKNRLDNKEQKNYFGDEKLNEIFNEFLQLRKKLKAVNSDRAINSLLNTLNKYDDSTKYRMIENSIRNSWKDVYPIKESKYEETQRKIEEWLNE